MKDIFSLKSNTHKITVRSLEQLQQYRNKPGCYAFIIGGRYVYIGSSIRCLYSRFRNYLAQNNFPTCKFLQVLLDHYKGPKVLKIITCSKDHAREMEKKWQRCKKPIFNR